MALMSSTAVINEIFTMLKEPFDPTGATDLSTWKRATILGRLNMAQDELTLELPDLFKTRDMSLLTVVGQMEYQIPATIGIIANVSLDGIQLVGTTREAIIADAIRGDLVDATEYVQDWASVQDQPYQWYQSVSDGTTVPLFAGGGYVPAGQPVLGLYPKPSSPAGQTIELEGEFILSSLTDSQTNYPLNNVEALRRAQKILIYKTAEVCAIEDLNTTYATYLHGAAEKMVESLRTYWNVLKPTDPSSTIRYKETEGPTTQTLRREVR